MAPPAPPSPKLSPPTRPDSEAAPPRSTAQLEGHGCVTLKAGSQPGQAQVTVSDLQGRSLDLEVEFTLNGPAIKLRAASVQFQTAGAFAIECQDFRVRAQQSIELQTRGNMSCEAEGYASTRARGMAMVATHGSILAKANDDVQLLGETILLNTEHPKPRPVWAPEVYRAAATLKPETQAGALDIIEKLR